MLMMNSAEYKVIPHLQVRFRSFEDNGSGGTTKLENKDFSTDESIEIGSGFFPTGFLLPAKYFTIRIYNLDSSQTKDIILNALHLYDELNYLPNIYPERIKLTNV